MTALALAALLLARRRVGLLNLSVDGVLHDGPARWVYGRTMALCLAGAPAPWRVRRRVGARTTFGLVLLGDLVYVVVVAAIEDPVRYSTPLMLLFPAFIARVVPRPVDARRHMAADAVACLVALAPSYDNGAALVIQVVVSAGDAQQRRPRGLHPAPPGQRLLVATETASRLDPLTGLFNRRYLAEQAPRVWRQARRDGTRVAAMVLDLDHFKRLNDAHGHAAGDAVLQAVAGSLAGDRPAGRPAGPHRRRGTGRRSGMVSDPDEAARLAERLRPAVAAAPHRRRARGHRLHRRRAGPAGRRRGRRRRAVAADRPGRRRDVRGQARRPRPGGRRSGCPVRGSPLAEDASGATPVDAPRLSSPAVAVRELRPEPVTVSSASLSA